jgi:putative two-component system response regulator
VHAVEELRHSRLETVERLVRAIGYHDGATGAHVNRMARVAAVLGQLAGLESDEINLLRAAAPMHDVGKIATPDEILRKPGKLTPEEFEVMKQHTTVGHKILDGSESPLLQMAARMTLDEAAEMIGSESGTHFDPSIASLLLDNLDEALARRG